VFTVPGLEVWVAVSTSSAWGWTAIR